MSMRFFLAALALCHGAQPLGAKPVPSQPAIQEPVAPLHFPATDETIQCTVSGFSGPQQILSDYGNSWYSAHLRAAEEPILYGEPERLQPGTAIVRFSWMRSFHPPVVIRIETAAGGALLNAKQTSRASGDTPGHIERALERALTPDEASQLSAMLARPEPFGPATGACQLGTDGSSWIFETVSGSGYRFITRWSPQAGRAREVGEFLLGLTGWHFDMVY